jgi:Fur family transcriptional regulator, ferric uptake regulator
MHDLSGEDLLDRASRNRLNRALAAVEAKLEKHGLRLTESRRQLVAITLDVPGCFRAEDLVRVSQRRGQPRASLSSVYRMVPVMIEAGLLREATFPTARGRFLEVAFERAAADHLRCIGCHTVVEYRLPGLDGIRRALSAEYGFELTGRRFEGYGFCRECRPKAASS